MRAEYRQLQQRRELHQYAGFVRMRLQNGIHRRWHYVCRHRRMRHSDDLLRSTDVRQFARFVHVFVLGPE